MARSIVTIIVSTREYINTHGLHPANVSRRNGPGAWLFRLDNGPANIMARGTYAQALVTAKTAARMYARVEGNEAVTLTVCP